MTTAATEEAGQVSRRTFITLSVMLATIMQALDTTIANVALPHMQGAMGATQDQISWVLTSYIVAAAIFMPLTGFISAKIGRKRLFMWSVAGFTVASMLCGAAQSLDQIVLFRLLQGIFGASLVPLSQAVLLDTYPPEKHGSAMAMWGIGVMVGPILGPSLGGWLTEYYNWRWVFYINLPFGLLAWFGLAAFIEETRIDASRRFDLLGFALLSLGIGALQMALDRGESQNWFASREIVIETVMMVMAFYLFVVHIFTHPHPYIEPALFKDRNFSVGLVFIFIVGIILLATMTLLPPFMQGLMGYPVIDVGYLLAPRYRNEGTALFSLVRNIGSSIGISVVITYLAQRTQMNHEVFASYINPFNAGLQQGMGTAALITPKGLAMLNGEVTRQASLLAYLQDFRLMMWVSLCAIPLVLLLKAPKRGGGKEALAILE